ncbi:MAG: hypothetical protein LBU76_10370 [Azoarcus sp.]|nr:hypothetical protein [Azoarcus sp.]
MTTLFTLPENAAPGDQARRRGTFCFLAALLATPITIWLFSALGTIWMKIEPLNGVPLFLAASLVGLLLAAAPIIALFGWLLALWYGVESVFMQRGKRTPKTDIVIVGVGLVAWFSPAFGFLATAIGALISGRVHFVRPARDYLLAVDPVAYWQGVGFMFITAAVFGWLAYRYWQSKLHRKRG